MRAVALTVALVVAKALGLAGAAIDWTPALVAALFWHDVACGLVFGAIDRWLDHHRALWIPYWAIVCLAAINVGMVHALASPLTWPMLAAAGGALSDSVWHYVRPGTVGAIAAVLGVGLVGPRAAARVARLLRGRVDRGGAAPRMRMGTAVSAVALVFVVLGVVAASAVDSRGLHRNGLTALLTTVAPRVTARAVAGSWRERPRGLETRVTDSLVTNTPVEDLTGLRGAALGKNVILIALESTGARYLSSYGAPDDPTPNFTTLARAGVQFDRAYVPYPESIKGLFATLCGRAPALDVSAEHHARASCDSLPRALAARGYRTALFHSGRLGYLGMDAIVAAQGFATVEDAASIGGAVESSFGVDEPSTVASMLAWIDREPADRPFLVTYLPVAGHHPYEAPQAGPYAGEGDLIAYKNALHYGDRALGVLLDGLRQRGLYDRSLVVVYGDHGEAFGQHQGNFGHSLRLYDENVRVPLVVTIPGVTDAGRRVTRVASAIDITPTILDLVGAPMAGGYEGASLLAPAERLALFATDYSTVWFGLQDGCTKYLRDVEGARDHLYDTCKDPDERANVESARTGEVRAYRAHLEAWASATRAAVLGSGLALTHTPRQ
jgi:hypothetical protein